MTGNSNPGPPQDALDVVDVDYGFLDDFSRDNAAAATTQKPAAADRRDPGDGHAPEFELDFLGRDEEKQEPTFDAVGKSGPVEPLQAAQPPRQQESAQAAPSPERAAPPKGATVKGFVAKNKWNILGLVAAFALCGTVLIVRMSPSDTAAARPPVAPTQLRPAGQSGPFEQRVQPQQVQAPVVEQLQLGQPSAEPEIIPEPSVSDLNQDPVPQFGPESTAQTDAAATPPAVPLTEEEIYYDNMAAAASNTGQAATAQASMQTVVQPAALAMAPTPAAAAADARFGEVSAQLSRTSADVVQLLAAVQQLRGEFATLQQQVKTDAGKTSAMALRLDNISNQLTAFEKVTNQKMEDISKSAVKAAMAALAKGTKKDDKLVLTGGRMVSSSVPAKPQVVQRQVAVAAKSQEPTRAVVKSPANSCNGPISQVWAVKGVSTAAGFIRREADGLGIMVNKDSEVRGFGTVISFDPANRVICTTSGKIVQR